jgi:5-(carboxyamino)imidazole ribonucleotide synthase
LKTAAWGYDGKGQCVVRSPEDAVKAWDSLGRAEAVCEAFIDFAGEVSVIGARGLDGRCEFYGPIGNRHANHILDVSVCPAPLDAKIGREAVVIARTVLETLEVVGVLCVEFFVTRDGRLLINELAPRPHNSGHLTIDAHATSQFEQQVRAVCGLPLGSAEQLRPAAMANLLGYVWADGEPNWPSMCESSHAKLHLYGKREPRVGRKMGHITALASTLDEAEARVRQAREALRSPR